MRLLLIMNGSRVRYAGGADQARYETWLPYCGSGTKLEIGYLPDVQERYEFGTAQAATKHGVLYPDRVEQAAREGYDAVVMHCCSDPGLEEARGRVAIPVVGPGEATLRAGAILGRRIGMTVPDDLVGHQLAEPCCVRSGQSVAEVEPEAEPVEQRPDGVLQAGHHPGRRVVRDQPGADADHLDVCHGAGPDHAELRRAAADVEVDHRRAGVGRQRHRAEPCAASTASWLWPALMQTNRPDQSATIRAIGSALRLVSASPLMTTAPTSRSAGAIPAAR
ncbi:MAG TPA: aspartate/glutamate racemase family protein [Jatrophihabitantaceae bacterium]